MKQNKAWMPGTRPGMTSHLSCRDSPAIRVFVARKQDVDARAKRGHDASLDFVTPF
jgi:hypothetical protein